MIHLSTDTWKSPNRLEFQAINAHFVANDGKLKKALLALPELHNGHAGPEVAKEIMKVLVFYELTGKVGYITGDNHGANDTLCTALSEHLLQDYAVQWDPVQHRLRCLGHIINLGAQAFFFAKDQEAVNLAIERCEKDKTIDIDIAIAELAKDALNAGWSACKPLVQLQRFVNRLRRRDADYREFRRLAGRIIHQPMEVRWNS